MADTVELIYALDEARPACAVTVEGHRSGEAAPWEAFVDGLPGRSWVQDLRFSADGPGGTGYAVRTPDVVCEVNGSWDDPGLLDEGEEHEYSDVFTAHVRCAADDTPMPADSAPALAP